MTKVAKPCDPIPNPCTTPELEIFRGLAPHVEQADSDPQCEGEGHHVHVLPERQRCLAITHRKRPAPVSGETPPIYTFTYNAIGQLETTTDPTELVVTNAYYANGNLQSTSVDATPALMTSYDHYATGDVKSVTNPRLYVTEYLYDNNRRKTQSLYHDGISISAPLIAASRTNYDLLGRVESEDAGTGLEQSPLAVQ